MKKWVQFYNSQKLPQAAAETKNLVISIPWGNNLLILGKTSNPVEALWYVSHVIENGISRNMDKPLRLTNQSRSNLSISTELFSD